MSITPIASFTSNPAVADYPGLALWFDHGDFNPVAVNQVATWACRVTGNVASITPAAGFAILKDAEGLSSLDIATGITVSGTMPTVLNTHYAVVVGVGKSHPSSSVAGCNVGFGLAAANVLALNTQAVANFNNANLNATATFAPLAVTGFSKPLCLMSYFDFVDPISPTILELAAVVDPTATTTLTFGSTTTTSGLALTPGLIGATLAVPNALGNAPDARVRGMMLFLFKTPVTPDELKRACTTIALTGKLPAIWMHKL